jgi:hypothetical protein
MPDGCAGIDQLRNWRGKGQVVGGFPPRGIRSSYDDGHARPGAAEPTSLDEVGCVDPKGF